MRHTNKVFLLIFLLCGSSILYSFYAQYHLKVVPCPLCITQRIIIIAICSLSLIFAIIKANGLITKIFNFIIAMLTVFGIGVALKHLWLINLPPEKQPLSCGIPLEVIYNKVPLSNFLQYILQGDAECAKIDWIVLGMKAPMAVVVLCSIILILTIYNALHKQKRTNYQAL